MSNQRADNDGLRVGELANASGLTVRTMHHWESIGLLVASGRSEAGHRRYSDSDVERLYRICSLQRLGLSLSEIGTALDDASWDLRSTVSTHLAEIELRLDVTHRLRSRLIRLLGSVTATSHPPMIDVLDVLEDMTMMNSPLQRRISILVYRDIEKSFEHLTSVFGLGPGEIMRDGDGHAVHAELEAGDGVVWLHPESAEFGLASPATAGVATATMAVMVGAVDAHYQCAASRKATIL